MSAKTGRNRAGRSPEEIARIRVEREQFQRERPGPDALVDSGQVEPTVPIGQLLALRLLTHDLREERKRQGLSLADVMERSGLERGMLSKLENGRTVNPTLETLFRYARALGKGVTLALEEPQTGPQ